MNRQERLDLIRVHSEMVNAAPDFKSPRNVMEDLDTLRRIGKWLHRHAERVCSDEQYCMELPKWEHIEEGKEARATAIVAQYKGLAIAFQGDPRGCALTVYRDNGTPYEYGRQHVVLAE